MGANPLEDHFTRNIEKKKPIAFILLDEVGCSSVCCEYVFFYYHWLIKTLLWPMSGQNIVRWESQTEHRETPAAAREGRC